VSAVVKFIVTESRTVVIRGWRRKEKGSCFMGRQLNKLAR
jgi:hypothetical protein